MTNAATELAGRTLQNETDIEVLTALLIAGGGGGGGGGGGSGNLDGGRADSIYGGTTAIDGGSA